MFLPFPPEPQHRSPDLRDRCWTLSFFSHYLVITRWGSLASRERDLKPQVLENEVAWVLEFISSSEQRAGVGSWMTYDTHSKHCSRCSPSFGWEDSLPFVCKWTWSFSFPKFFKRAQRWSSVFVRPLRAPMQSLSWRSQDPGATPPGASGGPLLFAFKKLTQASVTGFPATRRGCDYVWSHRRGHRERDQHWRTAGLCQAHVRSFAHAGSLEDSCRAWGHGHTGNPGDPDKVPSSQRLPFKGKNDSLHHPWQWLAAVSQDFTLFFFYSCTIQQNLLPLWKSSKSTFSNMVATNTQNEAELNEERNFKCY